MLISPGGALVAARSRFQLKSWQSWLFLALGGMACYWAWRHAGPPAALPEGARVDEFSAARARKNVETIARVPHPAGSPENAVVRDYILQQLHQLGVEASVERLTSFSRESAVAYRGGVVENIIGRIPGSANTKALLLSCHYDSVVEGPGAGDDGHAVAVLLETARALRSGPPLRNDILLLFTDAEEPAMMGGEAFMTQSAHRAEPGLALNFDVRGVRGPALMFETSQPDGALIPEFARAAPYPRASSAFHHVYERMPVNTDFTYFRLKGLGGFNFAFIEGGEFYHTSEDNLARLDDRSVQHQGSYSLSLARHFGNLSLRLANAPSRIYFNVGDLLVDYPSAWVWGIGAAILALTAGAVFVRRRGEKADFRAVLWAGRSVTAILLAAAFAGYGYFRLLSWIHVLRNELSFGQEYGGAWFLGALLILTGAGVLGLTSRLTRRLGRFEMLLGAALVQLLISFALSWEFPGASYLGHAGALSGALLLVLCLSAPNSPAVLIASTTASLLPAMFVWIPAARYLEAGMGTQVWPIQGFLLAELMIFASAALFEPSDKPARTVLATGLAAAIFFAAGLVSDRYDALHPRPVNAFYALDADRNAAYWSKPESPLRPLERRPIGSPPET